MSAGCYVRSSIIFITLAECTKSCRHTFAIITCFTGGADTSFIHNSSFSHLWTLLLSVIILLNAMIGDDSYHRRCGVDTDNCSDPYYQPPPPPAWSRHHPMCWQLPGSGSGLWPGPVRDGAEEGWPGSISWHRARANIFVIFFRIVFGRKYVFFCTNLEVEDDGLTWLVK